MLRAASVEAFTPLCGVIRECMHDTKGCVLPINHDVPHKCVTNGTTYFWEDYTEWDADGDRFYTDCWITEEKNFGN